MSAPAAPAIFAHSNGYNVFVRWQPVATATYYHLHVKLGAGSYSVTDTILAAEIGIDNWFFIATTMYAGLVTVKVTAFNVSDQESSDSNAPQSNLLAATPPPGTPTLEAVLTESNTAAGLGFDDVLRVYGSAAPLDIRAAGGAGGIAGQALTLTSGIGNATADTESYVIAQGGAADGTPGRVGIYTDGATGDSGDVLTADGAGRTVWADPAVPVADGLDAVLDISADADGHVITNLGDPTNDGDAANKDYVDDAVAAVPTPTLAAVLAVGNLVGGQSIQGADVAGGLGGRVTLTDAPGGGQGGDATFGGGDGAAGQDGGPATLRSGRGNADSDTIAYVVAFPGAGDGTPGRVAVQTGGSRGASGTMLSPDGANRTLWAGIPSAAGVPAGAPAGKPPLAYDSTAVTGGMYFWNGAAWVKITTIL